jgi:hypothetical protein
MFDLDRVLKSAKAPERPPEFWDQFPRRVSARIKGQEGRRVRSEKVSLGKRWLLFALSGAAACVLIGFFGSHWQGRTDLAGSLQNQKLVSEVLTMFPNQVQAIIQDEHGMKLSLADVPNVPSSVPLWIQVCDGNRCWSIVTFSGQTVQVAGKNVEVLSEGSGGVMLVGDQFFWSSENAGASRNFRIVARPLGQI